MRSEERRTLGLTEAGVELRADGDAQRFAGLAAVYGVRAAIGDPKGWGFFEEFAPGAATRTLAEFDQRMLIDHDTYYLVSRVSAGDLTLTETSRGVEVDSDLDEELSYVRDLRRNVEKRRITGMSIGFYVAAGGAEWQEIEVEEPRADGKVEVYQADLRLIREIELLEVSAVTFPAFPTTEADLRHGALPALRARGDYAAVARRAEHGGEYQAQWRELLKQMERPADPAPDRRHRDHIDRVMRGYQARYRSLGNPAR
ncbi:HK97 family phage prohead protease [Micromonospora haikouensis]|uniref:HK97 family phage prohead protease n=1 Tax=Micromonospora haikouensis TaxID=686309 RepID=UPI003792CFD2